MLELLENIRGVAAVKLGFIDDYKDSASKTPGVPKLKIVASPAEYNTVSGETIECKHIEGTIVNQLVRDGFDPAAITIAHPGGLMKNGVECEIDSDGNINIPWVYGYRTARMIMDGTAFYK